MQITTVELARNPEFLRTLRLYCASLSRKEGIRPYLWLDWLTDAYRDLPESITDESGDEVLIDMEVFEVPSIEFWFRDFSKPVLEGTTPCVRREALGRVIALSSILRARDPDGTADWTI